MNNKTIFHLLKTWNVPKYMKIVQYYFCSYNMKQLVGLCHLCLYAVKSLTKCTSFSKRMTYKIYICPVSDHQIFMQSRYLQQAIAKLSKVFYKVFLENKSLFLTYKKNLMRCGLRDYFSNYNEWRCQKKFCFEWQG